MSKKTTIYHPSLPAQIDVPTTVVKDWVEAGWRKTPPKDSTAAGTAAGRASDDKKGSED